MFMNVGLLGGKIKAGPRDMLQPYTMGIQEIGGTYGISVAKRGIASTIAEGKNIHLWLKELQELGHLPINYLHDLTTLAADDAMTSKLSKAIHKYGDRYSQVMNSVRIAADVTNRKTTLEFAKIISKDFFSEGNNAKQALKYIETRLPDAYRTEFKRQMRANKLTEESLTKIIADPLINRTQFRYNKAVASQMARDLGPLLTQFSKYPSEVAGSYLTEWRQFGISSTTQRALYPFFTLMALDQARRLISDEEELSPREQVFLYRRGFTDATPMLSVPSIMPGAGPQAQIYKKVLDLLNSPEAYESKLKAVGKMFDPRMAPMNFYEDLERLITGENPENW
jgi:hypothetical protein